MALLTVTDVHVASLRTCFVRCVYHAFFIVNRIWSSCLKTLCHCLLTKLEYSSTRGFVHDPPSRSPDNEGVRWFLDTFRSLPLFNFTLQTSFVILASLSYIPLGFDAAKGFDNAIKSKPCKQAYLHPSHNFETAATYALQLPIVAFRNVCGLEWLAHEQKPSLECALRRDTESANAVDFFFCKRERLLPSKTARGACVCGITDAFAADARSTWRRRSFYTRLFHFASSRVSFRFVVLASRGR